MRLRVLLMISALLAFAPAQVDYDMPASWTRAIEPFRIADNLYYVGTADLTAYLFPGDEGHILLDAPLEENVELVLDNIRKLGFDPRDVRIQLASHGHFDHTGGIAAMVAATGAELLLSTADATLVADGGRNDFFFGDRVPYPPASAARTLADQETVTLGATTLTANLTPGHTRGCTSWSGTVTIDGQPLTFVSVCSLSVLDGYQLVGAAASYPGIAADFCRSYEHLSSLNPDIFLGSHGSFIGLDDKIEALAAGDARAFVDPDRYHRYLDRALERIEQTLEQQGQEGGCAAVLAGVGQDLGPGRYCFQLDDDITTAHARLDLGDDGTVAGRLVATIHDEGNSYYTSYIQELGGTAEYGRLTLAVTTWIEYDVQESRETWSVGAEQLETEQHLLSPIACEALPGYFDESPAADEADSLDSESPVHSRRLELVADAPEVLTVENGVVRGERDLYLIAGTEGQRLSVKITSLERNAVFDLATPTGRFLATESTAESIVLPESGDYELIVGGTRGNASYTLALRLSGAVRSPAPTASSSTPQWLDVDGQPLPFQSEEQLLEFLREAEVVSARLYGEGITGLQQLVLERDGIQAHGAFHQIDNRDRDVRLESGRFRVFYDSYRGQCAAYALARLLQLGNVPPTVCRSVNGVDGSVQLWVEESLLESEREDQGLSPPSFQVHTRQMQRMRLLDNLIFNDDRHARNFLYDRDWSMWLIDHTRAFQVRSELRDPDKTTVCEREVWERLQAITADELSAAVSPYLESPQITTLVRRHELLLEHIRALIAERGEGAVLIESH